MRATQKTFHISESKDRLDEILNESDTSFEELKEIPDVSRLTFKNGYYVDCSSIFIDIRRSKALTDVHKRPTLAKIYRCFISEMVAVFSDETRCREINIQGDCVWGVFNTPLREDIKSIINVMARANSVRKLINKRLSKKAITQIDVGIGASYGTALMVKAGFYGSAINDIIYMGDVVNMASKMCSLGDTGDATKSAQVITPVVYDNLDDTYQKFFTAKYENGNYYTKSHYTVDLIDSSFDNWADANA